MSPAQPAEASGSLLLPFPPSKLVLPLPVHAPQHASLTASPVNGADPQVVFALLAAQATSCGVLDAVLAAITAVWTERTLPQLTPKTTAAATAGQVACARTSAGWVPACICRAQHTLSEDAHPGSLDPRSSIYWCGVHCHVIAVGIPPATACCCCTPYRIGFPAW